MALVISMQKTGRIGTVGRHLFVGSKAIQTFCVTGAIEEQVLITQPCAYPFQKAKAAYLTYRHQKQSSPQTAAL